MRKTLVVATLFFGTLSVQAQELHASKVRLDAGATVEKVMNILKTDGTSTKTRLSDFKQLSFLTLEEGGQGLLVKTMSGEAAAVLFEANPVVTISSGKLVVKSSSSETLKFEITDVAEICFGDAATSVPKVEGFSCVLQDGGVLFQGIPEGVKPCVYTLDGRTLQTPPLHDVEEMSDGRKKSQLRLSRETLGTGIFIVKVGTFSTKIRL